jgi:hypothetical protein
LTGPRAVAARPYVRTLHACQSLCTRLGAGHALHQFHMPHTLCLVLHQLALPSTQHTLHTHRLPAHCAGKQYCRDRCRGIGATPDQSHLSWRIIYGTCTTSDFKYRQCSPYFQMRLRRHSTIWFTSSRNSCPCNRLHSYSNTLHI